MPMDDVQVTTVSDCLDTNALDGATVALEKCVDQRGYCVEQVRSPKSQSPDSAGRTRQLGMEHITVHGQQIAFGNEPKQHQRVQAAMNKSKAATLKCKMQVEAHDNWVTALCYGEGSGRVRGVLWLAQVPRRSVALTCVWLEGWCIQPRGTRPSSSGMPRPWRTSGACLPTQGGVPSRWPILPMTLDPEP
jgi:hypothetical protein